MAQAPDPNTSSTEPLAGRAAVVAVVTVLLDLAVHFGAPVDADMKTLIIGLVSLLAPAVLAWWARRHVFSPATVATLLAARGRQR